MLKFSKANTKLKSLEKVDELSHYLQNKRKVYSFDLLSGWSCPYAKDCYSKVRENMVEIVDISGNVIGEVPKRTIQDGPNCQYRCFSASQEVAFTNTYNLRKGNFDGLKTLPSSYMMAASIADVLPNNLGICRIHVGGDFFNRLYFNAWRLLAEWYPDRLFYAYTKSLKFWVDARCEIPVNLVLTASRGGRLDHLIDEHNLREAKVVFSEAEAAELGYEIDHDDSHAARPDLANDSFALLIHGQQPAGSPASDAIKTLKKSGTKFAYGKASPHAVGV